MRHADMMAAMSQRVKQSSKPPLSPLPQPRPLMVDLLMGLVSVLLLLATCLWFVKLYSHDPAIEPLYRAATRLLGLFLLLWGLQWVRWLVRSSRQRKALRQQERDRANANYHLDQVRHNSNQRQDH